MSEEEKEGIKLIQGDIEDLLNDIENHKDYQNILEKEQIKLRKAVLNLIERLQKENKESKELYNKLLIGYNKLVQEYLELEKENEELKEENIKISKASDKMYEYISYYGWEDFESNTGCNREEMVDYFYKE